MNKFLCVMAGYDMHTEKHLSTIQDTLYRSGFTGTQTRDIPHHITLGTFHIDQEAELVASVKSVAGGTKAFSVSCHHIGIFGGSRVLFIAPNSNRSLLDLKESFGDSYGWTPHTTMLIDEPSIIYDALPVLAKSFTAFQGEVQSLCLYEFWPTRHILTLPLTKCSRTGR